MIRLSKTATADLRRIDTWLRKHAGGAVADSVVERILSGIQLLDRYPELGHPGEDAAFRELVVPRLPYVIFYRITADAVFIRRVLHGAMQWPRPKRDRSRGPA